MMNDPKNAQRGATEPWPVKPGEWPTHDNIQFVHFWNKIADQAHENAVAKGFWEKDRSDLEAIALMHSELSEAVESIRHGHPRDTHCPQFSNTEIELADLIIRVMDTSRARNYRVADAILAKMAFNSTRPRLHGKTC